MHKLNHTYIYIFSHPIQIDSKRYTRKVLRRDGDVERYADMVCICKKPMHGLFSQEKKMRYYIYIYMYVYLSECT